MAGEFLLYLASCFNGAADTSHTAPPPKAVEPVRVPPTPPPPLQPLTDDDRALLKGLGVNASGDSVAYDRGNGLLRLFGTAGESAYSHVIDGSDFSALSDNPSLIANAIRVLVKDNPAYAGLFTYGDRILFQTGSTEIRSDRDAVRVADQNYQTLLTLIQRGLETLYPNIDFSSYGSYGPRTATVVGRFQQDAKLRESPEGKVDRATLATLMIHLDHPKEKMIDELNDLRDGIVADSRQPFFLDAHTSPTLTRQIVRATQMAYPDDTNPHRGIVSDSIDSSTGLVDTTYTVLREKMEQHDLTLIGPEALAHLIKVLGGKPNEVEVVKR